MELKTINNLIEQCVYYDIARSQRQTEYKIGLDKTGTMGYEVIGCYDCKGYNNSCKSYVSKNFNEVKDK